MRHVAETGIAGGWYGYQWWLGELPSGERVVLGMGVGDQLLFVLPSGRLVVTIFAGQYNALEYHSDRILKRVLAAR